jgi:hypothetical protein
VSISKVKDSIIMRPFLSDGTLSIQRKQSGPKQRKKNCTEKRKQGSSKTLRYEKVDVTRQAWAKMRAEAEEESQRTSGKTGSLLVLTQPWVG